MIKIKLSNHAWMQVCHWIEHLDITTIQNNPLLNIYTKLLEELRVRIFKNIIGKNQYTMTAKPYEAHAIYLLMTEQDFATIHNPLTEVNIRGAYEHIRQKLYQ